MENLDLLCALFNQYVFQDAKNNYLDLKYYYDTNPNTTGNRLVQEFLDSIKLYNFESIDMPLFNAILGRAGKSGDEAQQILNKIIQYKRYNQEQIRPVKKYLEDIVSRALIQRAQRFDNPTEFVKYIKNSEFKSIDNDVFGTTTFDKIDVNTVMAESGHDVIKSSFDWVNESFTAGGMEKGQIGLVVAPPSTGKSLYLMIEALTFALAGHKTIYIALGDLNMKDFLVRLGAIYTGLPFKSALDNMAAIYTNLSEAVKDKLEISINAADAVSADDIVDFVKSRSDIEIVIVDYDSNLKGASSEDSMYLSLGRLYGRLTELTLINKLVLVAAQPKVYTWKGERIEMSDVGESSRKAHTADFIITLSRDTNVKNHLSVGYMAKNRRGENNEAYLIRLSNGRFKDLKYKSIYESIKQLDERQDYTDADIDRLIEQEQMARQQLKSMTGGFMGGNGPIPQPQQPQQKPRNNPFSH